MLRIYSLLAAAVTVWLAGKGGIVLCMPFGIAFLIGAIPVYRIAAKRARIKLLLEYGKRIDNIYEFSKNEWDERVLERAQAQEELLKEAGNETKVKVICYFFRSGEHCNEEWEEFEQRVALAIKADRAERHKFLEKEYPRLYKKFALNQNFIYDDNEEQQDYYTFSK